VNVDKLEEVVLEADVRVVCIFYYGIGDKVISLFQVPTYMMFKDGKKVGHATGVDGSSLHVSTSCLPSPIPHLRLEIDGVIRDELDMRCNRCMKSMGCRKLSVQRNKSGTTVFLNGSAVPREYAKLMKIRHAQGSEARH